jgi:hypothetical protein
VQVSWHHYRAHTASAAVFLILLVLVAGWVHSPVAMSNPLVIGNPEEIRYEGSGGLILPPSVNSAERNRVARCRDCSWKMTPACVPDQHNYCDAAVRSCPGLIDHVRTWFRPAGGDWVETGLICLTTYRVTTVAELDRYIGGNFLQHIPPLEPRCWPNQGVVVHLPYVCEAGQNAHAHRWSHSVSGFNVEVSATPHWTWNFAGSRLSTTSKGGPYPDLSVSHSFTSHGEKPIHVVSHWLGTFFVGDLGPFPIEQRLEQSKSWNVPIGEARARLMSAG